MLKLISIAVALLAASYAAIAATMREQAVAIDKINVTASESAEVERVVSGLSYPWSMAFLPGGDLLVTEKYSGIRLIRNGVLVSDVLPGGPGNVFAKEDSGFLDVVLDPAFSENRVVYISFVEGNEKANRTAIWKATYESETLKGGRVIFRSRPDKAEPSHPGGRMLFLPDNTLLLTIGDGYNHKMAAQDLASHLGKILRLTRDGAAADGNPFLNKVHALPEIWSYGHRNPQGLALDRATGEIWEHEHGPRGGDEVNKLKAGGNYGWPLVTHGIDYDGTIISERAFAPDVERSAFVWSPSIAPSGLAIYSSKMVPEWDGRLFVGALAARSLVRLRMGKDTGFFVEEERMFMPMKKRIRDVREGPDGFIYFLTDEKEAEILRARPKPS